MCYMRSIYKVLSVFKRRKTIETNWGETRIGLQTGFFLNSFLCETLVPPADQAENLEGILNFSGC